MYIRCLHNPHILILRLNPGKNNSIQPSLYLLYYSSQKSGNMGNLMKFGPILAENSQKMKQYIATYNYRRNYKNLGQEWLYLGAKLLSALEWYTNIRLARLGMA